jgi:hypothetical protein
MKKQVISTMAAMVFFSALAAVTSVHAQVSGNMSATIPFDFVVSARTLPAGKYYLRTDGATLVTQIRGKDNNQSAYLPVSHSVQELAVQEPKLVFNKYGDKYFLSQIWFWRSGIGREIKIGARERQLQRELARNRRKPESVAVAVKSK